MRRGFTIIELLISLMVLAIICAGLLPLLANSVSKNKEARLRLVAYETASQQIENLREEKIPSLVENSNPPLSFEVQGIDGATGELSISKIDTKLALVTSRVKWSFKGREQQVELNTYLYGGTE